MSRSRKRVVAIAAAGALALALAACSTGANNSSSGSSTSNSSGTPATSNTVAALDKSFGKDGIATVSLSSSAHNRFMAVAVGSDGKTYAAGFTSEGADQMMAVARLDEKGALDKSFGKDGIASINVAAGGKAAELARAIVIQPDNKIVIGGPVEHDVAATGDAAKDTDIAVARFDSTGKPDASFGKNGASIIDLGAGRATSATTFVGDTSWGLGLLPGDKLVVFASKIADGPTRTDADYVIVGLTNVGALDTSFGAGGKVVVDIGESGDSPRNVLVQSDGKIVATGYSNIAGVVQPVLVRFSAAGILDSGFGNGGIATTKVLAGVTESYTVRQQGSNYIIAGYGRGADATEKVDLVVERFTANGQWDKTFGSDGITRIDIAKDDDRARNLLVLPDDRIMIAGSGKKTAADVDAMLVLLSKDGAPVTTFGENGHLISDLGGPNDSWYGIALSADKKSVIIAGFKGVDVTGSGHDDAVLAKVTI